MAKKEIKHSPLTKIKFADPIFGISFHPEQPRFVVGSSTGTVTAYKYFVDPETATCAAPEVVWTTKRHKGSCRALIYSEDGTSVFSVGSDGVIKRADSETGKVRAKNTESLESTPSCIVRSEAYIAVGCEDGSIVAFDKATLAEKQRAEGAHDGECVNALLELTHQNKHSFASLGSTTACVVDVREGKGVVSTSDDQEDEILCGTMAAKDMGVCGMSQGQITTWTLGFNDQQNRIKLSEESIDAVIGGEHDYEVYAGGGEGIVWLANVKSGKKLEQYVHSRNDEVSFLDLDCQYRLVTASMNSLKLWPTAEDEQKQAEVAAAKGLEESKSAAPTGPPRKKHKKLKNKSHKPGVAHFGDL